jgi:flagellar protein FlbD
MIPLTRPDGSSILINPDRIEIVEETPDTVLTLSDGHKLLVRESAAEVATRFHFYQRSLHVDSRFGGRRAYDPPAEYDPALYEHPNRRLLRAFGDADKG